MRETFDKVFPLVMKHEGGYTNHPRDPGGPTNLGVTQKTLSGWLGRPATVAEVKALTLADVKPIYRRNYWDACGCDALPAGVDYVVFDPAVNSGPARARRWYAQGRRARAVDTIKEVSRIRRGFLQSLRTFDAFGKGWMRRVAEVEAFSLRLAMAGLPAATKTGALTEEARRSDVAADRARKATIPAAAGATAPGTTAAAAGWGWGEWALVALVTLAALTLVAALLHRHMAERERAKAMREATWSAT